MKLDLELLQKVANQLEKWASDPHTYGRQHEPMNVLANEIFRRLASKDGLGIKCFTYRGCNFYNTKNCHRACGNYPPPNQSLDSDTKYSGDPDNNPRKDVDIFHAPML